MVDPRAFQIVERDAVGMARACKTSSVGQNLPCVLGVLP